MTSFFKGGSLQALKKTRLGEDRHEGFVLKGLGKY